jgi:hypothetical protein
VSMKRRPFRLSIASIRSGWPDPQKGDVT